MYIDVHCHLNDPAFIDPDGTVAALRSAGVGLAICAGFDLESSILARDLAEKYPELYFSVGFQPQEIGKYRDGDIERLRSLSRHPKCLAVGEIGLDFHYPDNPSSDFQKEIFYEQLKMANEEGLPVVLHSRDAAAETLAMLTKNADLLGHGYLLHCYSYAAEMVDSFERLGGYFSFGGTSTFKNAKKVVKSAQAVGLDRLLSETDCPYLTPEPLRGEFPNTPANVPHIVQKLADIRGIPIEELAATIEQNARRLFTKWK